MVEVPSESKVKAEIQRRLTSIPDVKAALEAMEHKNNPNAILGILVLQKIYETHGIDGLKEFADLVTHPKSGILAKTNQTPPQSIQDVFKAITFDINAQINVM